VDLTEYVLHPLRKDDEFVLYRGERSNQPGAPSILLLTPASSWPALETIKKIEHEHSLRNEFGSAWAVRPRILSERGGQAMLVFEDPGGGAKFTMKLPVDRKGTPSLRLDPCNMHNS
jgi:hypothetical protein